MNTTAKEDCNIPEANQYYGFLKLYSFIESIFWLIVLVLGLYYWYKTKNGNFAYLRNRNLVSPVLFGLGLLSLILHSPVLRAIDVNSLYSTCFLGNITFVLFPAFYLAGFLIEIISFRNNARLRQILVKDHNNVAEKWRWFAASRMFTFVFGFFLFTVIMGSAVAIGLVTCSYDENNPCTPLTGGDPSSTGYLFGFATSLFLLTCYIQWRLRTFPDPFRILIEIRRCFLVVLVVMAILMSLIIYVIDPRLEYQRENERITFTSAIFGNLPLYLIFVYMVPVQAYKARNSKPYETISNQFDLERVLSDPTGHKLLKQYLVFEFSVENILFLDAIRHLSNLTDTRREEGVYHIYTEFVLNRRLNLSSEIYKELEAKFKAFTLSEGDFDNAYQHIFEIIEMDAFTRFKQSPMFEMYVGMTAVDVEDKL